MKILYITKAVEDYLSDSVFHGLVSLGEDVVDYNRLWYMWADNVAELQSKDFLYGKGFTLYGALPGNDKQIDRTDIKEKIKNRYFDYIIYGSVWRCMDLWRIVSVIYPPERLIMLDGEDHNVAHDWLTSYHYFKRELHVPCGKVHPISFSIPKVTYDDNVKCQKDQVLGTVIPGKQKTYKFIDQNDYYDDYRRSYFGVTMKKSGWDSLRHYEIIAGACLPIFLDFDKCPETVLYNYPRAIVRTVNSLISSIIDAPVCAETVDKIANITIDQLMSKINIDKYNQITNDVVQYARRNLTTGAIARYILDKVLAT